MGETSVSARGDRTCAPATYVLADKATALAITCCKICILALIRNWRRDGAAKSTIGSFLVATDAVTICRIIDLVVIVGDWIGAPRKTVVNGFEKFHIRIIYFRWICALGSSIIVCFRPLSLMIVFVLLSLFVSFIVKFCPFLLPFSEIPLE